MHACFATRFDLLCLALTCFALLCRLALLWLAKGLSRQAKGLAKPFLSIFKVKLNGPADGKGSTTYSNHHEHPFDLL
jgi:hypothetical protein